MHNTYLQAYSRRDLDSILEITVFCVYETLARWLGLGRRFINKDDRMVEDYSTFFTKS